MPPPPPRRIAALQQVGKPPINQCSTVASPHRSNTAATQLGWNPPQAYTQQQSANNKAVYDMVQVSNQNTHAMATQMAASFAEVATTTNAQAMQAVHTMQLAHAASSGNLINQLARSTRQAMDQMKNVVSSVIQVQHAQPMHAPTRVGLPLPAPNMIMSGGSSGSGGQNPTPVQWTARQGQVGTWNQSYHAWAENPQTDADWPGWHVHSTWTPIVPPTTSAAENHDWTWEHPHSMGRIWGTTEDECPQPPVGPFDLGQASAALAACSSDEDEEPIYIPEEGNDQSNQWGHGWQRQGLGHQNRLYRHTLFKL